MLIPEILEMLDRAVLCWLATADDARCESAYRGYGVRPA